MRIHTSIEKKLINWERCLEKITQITEQRYKEMEEIKLFKRHEG